MNHNYFILSIHGDGGLHLSVVISCECLISHRFSSIEIENLDCGSRDGVISVVVPDMNGHGDVLTSWLLQLSINTEVQTCATVGIVTHGINCLIEAEIRLLLNVDSVFRNWCHFKGGLSIAVSQGILNSIVGLVILLICDCDLGASDWLLCVLVNDLNLQGLVRAGGCWDRLKFNDDCWLTVSTVVHIFASYIHLDCVGEKVISRDNDRVGASLSDLLDNCSVKVCVSCNINLGWCGPVWVLSQFNSIADSFNVHGSTLDRNG